MSDRSILIKITIDNCKFMQFKIFCKNANLKFISKKNMFSDRDQTYDNIRLMTNYVGVLDLSPAFK